MVGIHWCWWYSTVARILNAVMTQRTWINRIDHHYRIFKFTNNPTVGTKIRLTRVWLRPVGKLMKESKSHLTRMLLNYYVVDTNSSTWPMRICVRIHLPTTHILFDGPTWLSSTGDRAVNRKPLNSLLNTTKPFIIIYATLQQFRSVFVCNSDTKTNWTYYSFVQCSKSIGSLVQAYKQANVVAHYQWVKCYKGNEVFVVVFRSFRYKIYQ